MPSTDRAETEIRRVNHGPLGTWVAGHPLVAFFIGAYLFSWLLWAPAALGYDGAIGTTVFFVGVLGPFVAAATVTHLSGRSVRAWCRAIFRLRFGVRWWLFALGLPFVIAAVSSALFVLVGESLDFDLVGERVVAVLPLLVVTFLVNGGPEEPGWRGFALPQLQRRFSPVRATLVLGVLWALWHLPLLAIEDEPSHGLGTWAFAASIVLFIVGVVLYAFPYTYLWNRTRSAVAAMALHAGFNTSLAVVILRDDAELIEGTYLVLQAIQVLVLLVVAVLLVVLTGGRLGRDDTATYPSASVVGRDGSATTERSGEKRGRGVQHCW